MGPELVGGLAGAGEDALLEVEVCDRGSGGAFLQGLVEPLVGPVLLRAPRGDALVGNACQFSPDSSPVVSATGARRCRPIGGHSPPLLVAFRFTRYPSADSYHAEGTVAGRRRDVLDIREILRRFPVGQGDPRDGEGAAPGPLHRGGASRAPASWPSWPPRPGTWGGPGS